MSLKSWALLLVLGLWACSGGAPAAAQMAGAPDSQLDPADAAKLASNTSKGDLERLLHWAIAHSNHSELQQHAAAVQDAGTLLEKQHKVKQMLDEFAGMPTEYELMVECVVTLNDSEASAADQLEALEALAMLVEPIDNANDLPKTGALVPLLDALKQEAVKLQAAAAHALGVAAANNPTFQAALLEEDGSTVPTLVEIAAECNSSAAGKALYALGNLVRTSPAARVAFAQADGWRQLARMLGEDCPLPVRRKAVALAGDLAGIQATCSTAAPVALNWEPLALLHQVEQLLEVADLDIQDKALEALLNLLAADASLVPVCKAGSLQRRLEAMEAMEIDEVSAPRMKAVVKVVTPAEAADRMMRWLGRNYTQEFDASVQEPQQDDQGDGLGLKNGVRKVLGLLEGQAKKLAPAHMLGSSKTAEL